MNSRLLDQNPRFSLPLVLLMVLTVLLCLSACDRSSSQIESDSLGFPPEPGEMLIRVQDSRSDGENGNWTSQFITGGVWADAWLTNQYERPYVSELMTYQPYLDIVEARIRPAGDWTIYEIEAVEGSDQHKVYISLELDTDLDDRPDLLILTKALNETNWTDSVITVLEDKNKDAGGNRPRLAEPYDNEWNGFEGEMAQLEQGKTAYVRRSPDSSSTYQIAVLNEILSDLYIWRVWLEGENFYPGWVEYNDRYTLEQAGSPYLYSPNYPVKELSSLDNTCLHFFGGELSQPQPGHCGTRIDLNNEILLPPDDQYNSPVADNQVSIHLPENDPKDPGDSSTPIMLIFNPGYFYQPSPTPEPHLSEFPVIEFVIPDETEEGVLEAVIATPDEITVVIQEPLDAVLIVPTPVEAIIAYPTATDLFDPYAGSTPPPTDLFDPYQGSTPTPIPFKSPLIRFNTPTP